MALQGTLDTFALADLVRLLATTGKTGQLTITGDRGRGALWFVDGALVAGEPAGDDVADAVFALLRFEEGDFAFAADAVTEEAGDPASALDALSSAEARLAAWLPVAELVPTPMVTLTLAPELPADAVSIDRARWRQLLLVAGGTTAGAFGAAQDLDEMATGFAVRDLVDAGLITVGEPLASEPVGTDPSEPAVSSAPAPAAPEADAARIEAEVEAPSDEAAVGDVPVEAEPPTAAPDLADVVALTPEPLSSVLPGLPHDERYRLGDWEDPEEIARPLLPTAADEVAPVLATEDLSALEPEPEPEPEPEAEAEAEPTQPSIEPAAEPAPERPLLATDDSWATAEVAPSALGPWEPLTPAVSSPSAGPVTDDPIDSPAVSPWTEPAPTPVADLPAEPGSFEVDLDRQLGASAPGHSYLGTSDAPAGLPEPLLGGPEPLLGSAPEPLLSAAPPPPTEPEARPVPAPVPDDDRPWAGAEDGPVPVESLSPAAARAVAAAAHGDEPDGGDTDAGRRVLRRIISTGKG